MCKQQQLELTFWKCRLRLDFSENTLWVRDLHAGVLWRVLSATVSVRRQDWAEGEGKLQGSCHRDFNQSYGSSKAGCPNWEPLPLYLHNWPVIGFGLPPGRAYNPGRGIFFHRRQFWREIQLWAISSQHSWQLYLGIWAAHLQHPPEMSTVIISGLGIKVGSLSVKCFPNFP